jgi:hypothetical protein
MHDRIERSSGRWHEKSRTMFPTTLCTLSVIQAERLHPVSPMHAVLPITVNPRAQELLPMTVQYATCELPQSAFPGAPRMY